MFHSCKEEKFEWEKRAIFGRWKKKKIEFYLGKIRFPYYGIEYLMTGGY